MLRMLFDTLFPGFAGPFVVDRLFGFNFFSAVMIFNNAVFIEETL